jgi:hypothetical protein
MARIPSLPRTLSSSIPLARSLAGRAVVTVRPVAVGLLARVGDHLPGRPRQAPSPAPETFTPSAPPAGAVEDHDVTEPAPSPATIARNVAAPRPAAKQPGTRKPRQAPGAKLPVRRPSPST